MFIYDIMFANHLYDSQYLYMIIMEFKTFPYLKTINHGYGICIGKSWYQKLCIWVIKHALNQNEIEHIVILEKPFISMKNLHA